MARSKKGLQKFTELETKFQKLLVKEKITMDDVEALLSSEEISLFNEYLTDLVNKKTGDDLDAFYERISEITSQRTKNQLWESNHYRITSTISCFIAQHGILPSKYHIAEVTGLSRATIHKHLKDYSDNPLYVEEMRKFKIASDRLLATLFKFAMQGNVKAARLFFEIMGNLDNPKNGSTLIQNQNNFVQINGMTLSQADIAHLLPNQIQQIENVFKEILSYQTKLPN